VTEHKLCRDAIRENELAQCSVAGRVHSDGQFVTVTMDRWTFDYIRRKLSGGVTFATRTGGAEILPMREMQVTLSVE
jgi:hypothetical protein